MSATDEEAQPRDIPVTALSESGLAAARALLTIPAPALPLEETDRHGDVPARVRAHRIRVGRSDRRARGGAADLLAARKATPGALSQHYDIPAVSYRRGAAPALVVLSMICAGAWAADHAAFTEVHQDYLPLLPLWFLTFTLSALPLFLTWADKPYKVTTRQLRQLAELRVVVAVPVYNEDLALLDRCLWSLANSSRPPEVIHVVEDGPSVDYGRLREHWLAHCPRIRWTVLARNRGKKRRPVRRVHRAPGRRHLHHRGFRHHAGAPGHRGGPQALRRSRRGLGGGHRRGLQQAGELADHGGRGPQHLLSAGLLGHPVGLRRRADQPGHVRAVPGPGDQGDRARLRRRDVPSAGRSGSATTRC